MPLFERKVIICLANTKRKKIILEKERLLNCFKRINRKKRRTAKRTIHRKGQFAEMIFLKIKCSLFFNL
uniref:Candidate secreted effector n=1 Tax=Meloidogyne incognita TaxID=6306 RepID=A0A914NUQ4_MELIC